MRMKNWLDQRAALTPDRAALIGEGFHITFGELRERAADMACRLGGLGVAQGDRVALLCGNGPHVPLIVHALHYLGAVLLPLNTRLTAGELEFQLRDAACAVLLYDEPFRDTAGDIGGRLPGLTVAAAAELAAAAPAPAKALRTEIVLDEIHSIMYTSGTTGKPKGVLLTYGNHWSSAVGSMLNLGLTERDRWLACVPLFHISGLSILMRSVIYGIPAVIHEKFDPRKANRAIMEGGITVMSVVSNMLSRMIDELGGEKYPDAFRCMLLGGGSVPLSLLERCRDKGIPVYQTYGMTETASQIATLPPEYMFAKLGSAGKPLFLSELRIVKDGREVPPRTEGEIAVRGPNVAGGYLNRPEATAEAIRDGWLHTGDIGYVDEDGFLYVLDRRSDLIISGGENVYPAEIESVLTSHPAVEEAGVTGADDPAWGQVPVAFVKFRDGAAAGADELRAFCAERLAKYKIPTRFIAVDALPRTA